MSKAGTLLSRYWRFFFLIVVPIILLPLIFIDGKDADCTGTESECKAKEKKFKCAYVIVVMAFFWVTEAMPLAVTSLLPILFFPLLGVDSTDQVTANYMRESIMVFFGAVIIATAIEYCNLHNRIALRLMTIIGSSLLRLLLGTMITTCFLSMWLTNAATVAMMLPIVVAILDELHDKNASTRRASKTYHEDKDDNFNPNIEVIVKSDSVPFQDETESNTRKMFLLATCYSANLGGTGTLIGSAMNLVVHEHIQRANISQGGKYSDLTFATWMAYAVPGMFINLFVVLVYLNFSYQILPRLLKKVGPRSAANEVNVGRMLRKKYIALGPITFHEIAVSIIFFIVVMLWLFRNPRFVEGWGNKIPGVKIGDSTASMFGVFLLFVIPRKWSWKNGVSISKKIGRETLMDWKYAQARFPWGIMLLLGAGFAVSSSAEKSGLSEWIGIKLEGLESLPPEAILIILMFSVTFITEIASNASVAGIVIPIVMSMSRRLNLHPLYLTIPTTQSTSFAFMLPVGTPINAMVFATGDLRTVDMIKTGFFLNMACIIVVFVLHISYSTLIFDYDNYVYANSTVTVPPDF